MYMLLFLTPIIYARNINIMHVIQTVIMNVDIYQVTQ